MTVSLRRRQRSRFRKVWIRDPRGDTLCNGAVLGREQCVERPHRANGFEDADRDEWHDGEENEEQDQPGPQLHDAPIAMSAPRYGSPQTVAIGAVRVGNPITRPGVWRGVPPSASRAPRVRLAYQP